MPLPFPLRLLAHTLVLSLSLLAGTAAIAQSPKVDGYPSHPIRLILPLGPGSSSEAASRFIGEKLAATLGQQVLPENRPGGEMQIALQALLSAPPDGHTIMMISPSNMVLNPIVIDGWNIDVKKRIRPLVLSTRTHALLVVREDSKLRTLADAIEAARAKPGSVSVANYSANFQAAVTTLGRSAGVEFNHVPYKGAGQILTDVIGGNLDMAITDIAASSALIAGGKLRALAVTSTERLPMLSQVPTVRESGYKDYEFAIWIGYGVRSETPEPVAQLLTASLQTILRSPEFAAFNRTNGNTEVVAADGATLARQIDAETARLRKALNKPAP